MEDEDRDETDETATNLRDRFKEDESMKEKNFVQDLSTLLRDNSTYLPTYLPTRTSY